MTQPSLDFDRVTFSDFVAETLKAEGQLRAELHHRAVLTLARNFAREHAEEKGWVTIDEVQEYLITQGLGPADLGNAAGSVFRYGFEATGAWNQSRRVSRHHNWIQVWRLKASE